MTTDAALWEEIAAQIGFATEIPFAARRRLELTGGCINHAYRLEDGGRAYFVKVNITGRLPMFEAEAAGLTEITRSAAVRVPQPVCHGANETKSWLVLEYVALEPLNNRGMRELGQALPRMHRVTAERFGWKRDNTIGATPQVNTPGTDWVAFWREHRLGCQLRLAAQNGHRGRLLADGERLLEKLPAFFAGYTPRPSLLHGDLWSGNAGGDTAGKPVIFDPAVYYGDREADLAMTELFGGFSQPFYEAYHAEDPLDAGYGTRKHLYNLYHVLNHLNLFGGGYRARAERMIEQLLAAV